MTNNKFKNLAVIPNQCHLWNETNPSPKLETLKQYPEDSYSSMADNSSRSLKKCTECDQLYFYEMSELYDLEDGDDSMYRTYIPVASEKEADMLAVSPEFELLRHVPRINWGWPKGKDKTVAWIKT